MQAIWLGQIESFDFVRLKVEPTGCFWCNQGIWQGEAAEYGLQISTRVHRSALRLYAGVEPIQNLWHVRPQMPTLGNQLTFHRHQTNGGAILDLNTGHVDADRCSSRTQLRELRACPVHEQREACANVAQHQCACVRLAQRVDGRQHAEGRHGIFGCTRARTISGQAPERVFGKVEHGVSAVA